MKSHAARLAWSIGNCNREPAAIMTSTAQTQDQLAALAGVFHLMGDPSRLSILMTVLAGPRPVGEIAAETGLSPSLVSHHLRLLRGGRLVRADRRGKQVFYAIDDAHISSVLMDMAEHVAEPAAGGPQAGHQGGPRGSA
jgi:DNA-binding transcriptional ArsR family regulator